MRLSTAFSIYCLASASSCCVRMTLAGCPFFGNCRSDTAQTSQADVDQRYLEWQRTQLKKTPSNPYANNNEGLKRNRILEEDTSSTDINKYFVVDSFGTAKKETYNDVSNMLIVTWDIFYLYQNGMFTNQTWSGAAPLDDSIYTLTKTISHTILGAFGVCYNGMSLARSLSGGDGCKAIYGNSSMLSPDDFLLSLDLVKNVTVDKDLKESVSSEAYPVLKDSSDAIILHFTKMMKDIMAADCSYEFFFSIGEQVQYYCHYYRALIGCSS